MKKAKLKKLILFFGDVAILYFSLFAALALRYGPLDMQSDSITSAWKTHQIPFLWIYAIWILVFYSAGMYDWEKFTPSRRYYTGRVVLNSMLANFAIAIALFYSIRSFSITPKTNLILVSIISAGLLWAWRTLFLHIISKGAKIKVIFFGSTEETKWFADYVNQNPSLGYKIEVVTAEEDIRNALKKKPADLIVVEPNALENKELVKMFYEVLPMGISIMNFAEFHEHLTGKVPTSLITESWFLENLMELNKQSFETMKRGIDIIGGAVILAITFLFYPIVGLFIILDSEGPVLFRQARAGKNGKAFSLVKFRSMVKGAEEISGLKESSGGKKDARITRVGKILRKIYIDELPQVINIIKGEMSFVGPRPERPEFVKVLKTKVPYYDMRLLVRPGITGWAQISMKNDASVEDAPEKLQYDLYYIKNRTITMDLAIMLKTLTTMLGRSGK
ncbi:exopolysaccharide biosynthesis polyprenyl glycosylphosphotransferase [Candidatus Giovannonibacteria bacterium]|nr:exopolysaccharide biosynthesis polyprenyl glycosylphosphotransferase [Candidatus Giovannonibacteria bacterium]